MKIHNANDANPLVLRRGQVLECTHAGETIYLYGAKTTGQKVSSFFSKIFTRKHQQTESAGKVIDLRGMGGGSEPAVKPLQNIKQKTAGGHRSFGQRILQDRLNVALGSAARQAPFSKLLARKEDALAKSCLQSLLDSAAPPFVADKIMAYLKDPEQTTKLATERVGDARIDHRSQLRTASAWLLDSASRLNKDDPLKSSFNELAAQIKSRIS